MDMVDIAEEVIDLEMTDSTAGVEAEEKETSPQAGPTTTDAHVEQPKKKETPQGKQDAKERKHGGPPTEKERNLAMAMKHIAEEKKQAEMKGNVYLWLAEKIPEICNQAISMAKGDADVRMLAGHVSAEFRAAFQKLQHGGRAPNPGQTEKKRQSPETSKATKPKGTTAQKQEAPSGKRTYATVAKQASGGTKQPVAQKKKTTTKSPGKEGEQMCAKKQHQAMKITVPDSDSEMAEQFHEAPAPIVPAAKSRAPPVRTYDHSKPTNYPAFRTFLEAQWVLTGSNYSSQAEFILHCYGHLVDTAASQVHNYVKTMLKKPQVSLHQEANVEKFLDHLDTLFVDPAAAARALHQVSTLRANLSASPQAHVSRVTQLLHDAGSSAWADNVKKRQLTATLPKKENHVAWVVPELTEDLLIGYPWLKKKGALIDCAKDTVTFKSGIVAHGKLTNAPNFRSTLEQIHDVTKILHTVSQDSLHVFTASIDDINKALDRLQRDRQPADPNVWKKKVPHWVDIENVKAFDPDAQFTKKANPLLPHQSYQHKQPKQQPHDTDRRPQRQRTIMSSLLRSFEAQERAFKERRDEAKRLIIPLMEVIETHCAREATQTARAVKAEFLETAVRMLENILMGKISKTLKTDDRGQGQPKEAKKTPDDAHVAISFAEVAKMAAQTTAGNQSPAPEPKSHESAKQGGETTESWSESAQATSCAIARAS
ncbi:hypothetical protein CFO_g5540 [Ceratocystis platani]|uniref:Uncharacterized protein n=1 Tax=Ceratocystis fimbriata f. sp. platani TaxID=88771 RepID=A0A0F8CMZ8_CERFI|nr:hypothetical protein CFO_g5540 [Ceratocystis platani]